MQHYWTFVRGIHRSPVNSSHKGQWRGALMLSLICAWINASVNNRDAGDLWHHRTHYAVIVFLCSIEQSAWVTWCHAPMVVTEPGAVILTEEISQSKDRLISMMGITIHVSKFLLWWINNTQVIYLCLWIIHDDGIYHPPKAITDDPVSVCLSACLSVFLSVRLYVWTFHIKFARFNRSFLAYIEVTSKDVQTCKHLGNIHRSGNSWVRAVVLLYGDEMGEFSGYYSGCMICDIGWVGILSY